MNIKKMHLKTLAKNVILKDELRVYVQLHLLEAHVEIEVCSFSSQYIHADNRKKL
jgi:hypothetical protein